MGESEGNNLLQMAVSDGDAPEIAGRSPSDNMAVHNLSKLLISNIPLPLCCHGASDYSFDSWQSPREYPMSVTLS